MTNVPSDIRTRTAIDFAYLNKKTLAEEGEDTRKTRLTRDTTTLPRERKLETTRLSKRLLRRASEGIPHKTPEHTCWTTRPRRYDRTARKWLNDEDRAEEARLTVNRLKHHKSFVQAFGTNEQPLKPTRDW